MSLGHMLAGVPDLAEKPMTWDKRLEAKNKGHDRLCIIVSWRNGRAGLTSSYGEARQFVHGTKHHVGAQRVAISRWMWDLLGSY